MNTTDATSYPGIIIVGLHRNLGAAIGFSYGRRLLTNFVGYRYGAAMTALRAQRDSGADYTIFAHTREDENAA